MEKARKSELIVEIKELMNNANAIYLVDFAKMTVENVNELRGEFHKANVKYKVVKNTLALRAIKESSKFSAYGEGLEPFLIGHTGIVFAAEDTVAPAKILKKYADKIEKPKFKAAILEGELYGSNKLAELSSLLSKDELIAGICGSLNSPVSGIVGSINAVLRDLASVIEEAAKTKAA